MATGDPFSFENSLDYYRELDHMNARDHKRDALDSDPLVKLDGLRVILIEEVEGVRHGVMDGVVMQSDDGSSLIVKDLSNDSIHRFPTPSDFDWYQARYFVKSTWWRRRKYMTR